MENFYNCTTYSVHNTRHLSLSFISVIEVHKVTKPAKSFQRNELMKSFQNITKNAELHTYEMNVSVFMK